MLGARPCASSPKQRCVLESEARGGQACTDKVNYKKAAADKRRPVHTEEMWG